MKKLKYVKTVKGILSQTRALEIQNLSLLKRMYKSISKER